MKGVIYVAMSGGVDSSVAAALLLEAGWDVRGVSLRLWDSPRRDDRVCSDHRDASGVAAHLGIEHTVIDEREAFEREVVAPFVDAYARGETPNPCMACNKRFKLGSLLDWAIERGADAVATGHYVRVTSAGTEFQLRRGIDESRDQSYFLFELDQAQLRRLRFPLGDLPKAQVRSEARRFALPSAESPESQDLCFGNPAALVRARGQGGESGEIVDESGRALGRHEGVEGFTLGQRRGLGVAAASPLYVRKLDAEQKQVTVGTSPLHSAGLRTRDWHWVGRSVAPEEVVEVRVRSRQSAHRGAILRADGRGAEIRFADPVPAIARGQAAVAYIGDEVVGGGWIQDALPAADLSAAS